MTIGNSVESENRRVCAEAEALAHNAAPPKIAAAQNPFAIRLSRSVPAGTLGKIGGE